MLLAVLQIFHMHSVTTWIHIMSFDLVQHPPLYSLKIWTENPYRWWGYSILTAWTTLIKFKTPFNILWKFQLNTITVLDVLQTHHFDNLNAHIVFCFNSTSQSTFSYNFSLITLAASGVLRIGPFDNLNTCGAFWLSSKPSRHSLKVPTIYFRFFLKYSSCSNTKTWLQKQSFGLV